MLRSFLLLGFLTLSFSLFASKDEPAPADETAPSSKLFSSQKSLQYAGPRPLLILNFDVNKTLYLADPVSGMEVEDLLNSCVSEAVFGKVSEEGQWKISILPCEGYFR